MANLAVTLPTDSERHRQHIGMAIAEKYPVITRFRVKFDMPLGSESYSHAAVDAGFIDAIRRENIRGRNQSLVEAKKRIESGYRRHVRRGELLVPMIETAPSDEVHVGRTPRIRVHNGIERERPDVHVSAGKSSPVECRAVDVRLSIVELHHRADLRIEVIAGARAEIPPRIELGARPSYRFGESTP